MRSPFPSPRSEPATALDDDAQVPAPPPWPASVKETQKVFFKLSEARLVRAYLALFLIPWSAGSRNVRLARFGVYEVRLVEFEHDLAEAGSPLWLELYRHDTCESLDACGCDEFDMAVRVADELTAQASELHRADRPNQSQPSR